MLTYLCNKAIASYEMYKKAEFDKKFSAHSHTTDLP